MDLPAALFALRWLIRDTSRQARASGITAAMLLVTAVCTFLCLSISVTGGTNAIPLQPDEDRNFLPRNEAAKYTERDLEGIEVPQGEMTLLFGAIRTPIERSRDTSVRYIEAILAGGIADTAGVLLALIWTAGFLPNFLEPATATVLFAKPFARWVVLVGKTFSILLLVGGQALFFVGAIWLALGVRTQIWDLRVFAVVPLLLVHFCCFFAFSAALAVLTRSTIVCVLGTFAIWSASWFVNYTRHSAVAAGVMDGFGFAVLNTAYWLMPKPADLGMLLVEALHARDFFSQLSALANVRDQTGISPELTILSSLFLPAGVLVFAGWRLSRTEY